MSGHTYTHTHIHTYTHTYIHTHRTTTVTLAAHARRGLTSTVTLAHARRGLMKCCMYYIGEQTGMKLSCIKPCQKSEVYL